MPAPEGQLFAGIGKCEKGLYRFLLPTGERHECAHKAHEAFSIASFRLSALSAPFGIAKLHRIDIAGNDFMFMRK